jgi:outer membrane cobalamin receptor
VDAALQRPVAGFTAAASYAFVHTEVTSTVSTGAAFQPGQPLLRRPRHSGSMRVGYAVRRVDVHADARFVGQRHDSAFLGLATLAGTPVDMTVNPGYTVVGLGASYRLAEAISALVRIDNVGDGGYENALGYPGLPRAVMVGVRFGFERR